MPEPVANHASDPEIRAGSRRRAYVFAVAFTAAVGGFLFGYDLSLIGAANVFLKEQFHLGEELLGFTTASAALGCMFGPFLGAWLCDAVGRERTMMVASLLLAGAAMMTALAQTITLFNMFRIIGGVGVGLCSVASPLYIAEIAPAKLRGSLGIMYQLAIVVGSTAAPLVAYVLVRVFPEASVALTATAPTPPGTTAWPSKRLSALTFAGCSPTVTAAGSPTVPLKTRAPPDCWLTS